MKKILLISVALATFAFGHSATMNCFDNGDGTITCEGGFSDGSSASGVGFRVVQDGKVLTETKFNEDSEFTFKVPSGKYEAHLDAGEGHKIILKSQDIN